MTNSRNAAALLAVTITMTALMLVADRGGLIAWCGLLLGVALLLKIWVKPSNNDLRFGLGTAAALLLASAGSFYYVISTWETGEVVELAIETETGTHTARVWVIDIDDHPVIYYDAPSGAATSLLAGRPVQFTRGTEVSRRIPLATRADDLTEVHATRVIDAMAGKYGARVDAADIYYLMLGRSRDRIAVVATLSEG